MAGGGGGLVRAADRYRKLPIAASPNEHSALKHSSMIAGHRERQRAASAVHEAVGGPPLRRPIACGARRSCSKCPTGRREGMSAVALAIGLQLLLLVPPTDACAVNKDCGKREVCNKAEGEATGVCACHPFLYNATPPSCTQITTVRASVPIFHVRIRQNHAPPFLRCHLTCGPDGLVYLASLE